MPWWLYFMLSMERNKKMHMAKYSIEPTNTRGRNTFEKQYA